MKTTLAEAPRVVVTGAAGAIGGAIAREIATRRPRAELVLVDRDAEGAQRVAHEIGSRASAMECDLSLLDRLPAFVERLGPIDGLVNAAGFMEVKRFESMPWQRVQELLNVDMVAPLQLLHATLGGMLERGAGFVVNVTSMAGRVALKGVSAYGAAKAGLSMASEILHAELGPRGVHVVTVYPGPVASALERGARAQFEGGALARAIPTGRARPLAKRVLDALERGEPRVVYPGWYSLGFSAAGLASRAALALGPNPLA